MSTNNETHRDRALTALYNAKSIDVEAMVRNKGGEDAKRASWAAVAQAEATLAVAEAIYDLRDHLDELKGRFPKAA